MEVLSKSVAFRGLLVTLAFGSGPADDERHGAGAAQRLCASVVAHARLSGQQSREALQYGIPGRCSITIASNMPHMTAAALTMHQAEMLDPHGCRCDNLAKKVSRLPGDPLLMPWWDPFLVDGHVRLTAVYQDERTHNEVDAQEGQTDEDASVEDGSRAGGVDDDASEEGSEGEDDSDEDEEDEEDEEGEDDKVDSDGA